MNNQTYLDAVFLGKNDAWRYLIAVPLILIMWVVVGSLPTTALVVYLIIDGDPGTYVTPEAQFVGVSPVVPYILALLSFWALLLGLWVAVRLIHRRSMLTLITPQPQVNWQRILHGFVVWLAVGAGGALVEALIFPGRYQLIFDAGPFFLFMLASLLLIPIQTSAEELFLRGYILQSFGLRLRRTWVLCLISGVLFALPHFANPEVEVNFWLLMIFYFAIGVFFAWITLRDQGLELALGAHAANNLFAAMVASYPNSALQTSSLFFVGVLDPVYNLLSALVMMLVFSWVVFKGLRFNR